MNDNSVDKMLTIIECRQSQSGKTLGVKAHDDIWYTTKCWDIQGLTGQAILANTSQSEFNGRTMNWINDYKLPGQAPATVATPATPPPPAAPQPPVAPPPVAPPATVATVNRDASIVAQTLCKSITFTDPDSAFKAYTNIYGMYTTWAQHGDPGAVYAHAQQDAHEPAFPADDIPF